MKFINDSEKNIVKSKITTDEMCVINPPCDNYELYYDYDIEYIDRNGHKLYLQIITPIGVKEKTPLIIFIPGSAFKRQNVKGRVPQLALLATKGYAIALLEYRGVEDAPFPSFVLDAKAGIKFMKTNANKYNIDADKVFVMGDSSGGYTALMAGLTLGIDEFEDAVVAEYDYSVKGIIDYYGPTDITRLSEDFLTEDELSDYDDSTINAEIGVFVKAYPELAQNSIIEKYLSEQRYIPPIIMIHGTNDPLVSVKQSIRFYQALKKHGKNALLYQIEGAHHGDRQFWSEYVLNMLVNFINSCLN